MARAATTDFEGKETAVLIATQAWVNAMHDTLKGTAASTAAVPAAGSTPAVAAVTGTVATNLKANSDGKTVVFKGATTAGKVDLSTKEFKGSGFSEYRNSIIPVINAYADKGYTEWYEVSTTAQVKSNSSTAAEQFPANFINYNALLGDTVNVQGVNNSNIYIEGTATTYKAMANIYFDKDCFRCETGFLTSANGRVQYNNIVGNLQKTGTTEYIPNGAKFECFLVKDTSGTTVGIAMRQINNV
ncbi:MAG: hypothetical protein IJ593_10010 [Lachnospiraceae bacterium]|nr:hypothetical protein [Lachnospiraceae bacterium]